MTKRISILFSILLSSCLSFPRHSPNQNGLPSSNLAPPLASSLPGSEGPSSDTTAQNPLRITILDVGQGDSTLITAPNGKTLLIDAGRKGKGRETILPYLKEHSIHSLDAILATHYDGDHIGGIDEVIAGEDGQLGTSDDMTPKIGIFDRGGTPFDNAPSYPGYVLAAGNHRKTITTGEKIPLDSTLTIRCVAVNGEIWNGAPVDLGAQGFSSAENSSSIALLIEHGTFRYLTAGDLTGGGSPGGFQTFDVESPLAQSVGAVSIVHANHHGSLTSSNENYVNALKPLVTIFSVGDGNEYGHPAQEVLERWRSQSSELWLTEKGAGGFIADEHVVNGPIEIETDGNLSRINGQTVEGN